MRRASLAGLVWVLTVVSVPAQDWPRNDAIYTVDLFKSAGMEMTDTRWAHLGVEHDSVGLAVRITTTTELARPLPQFTKIQIRYTVRGSAVSPWLDTPFTYTLQANNAGLPALDGIFPISVEVQGIDYLKYKPRAIFLHLSRGRAVDPLVPIISRDTEYEDYGVDSGPGIVYVDYRNAVRGRGYPVDPSVVAWHGDTTKEPNLYQEELAPHTDLFRAHQFWWEEPPGSPNAGLKFVRAFVPKHDEDHRTLRTVWKHDRFPFIDGPRGVAWTSPYVWGQVDATGGFAFAETGGSLRYMKPDGEVITIAGWRVKPDKDPIWYLKEVDVIRQNMEKRGIWVNGAYANGDAFRTPLDVAIDPQTPRVYYVAGYDDHCIWKVVAAQDFSSATVSVFAGDVNHTAGFANGMGTAARFHGPSSLVFDPVCDCLYVADQDNDAIRRISRAGAVTTLVGAPGAAKRLWAAGVTDAFLVQEYPGVEGRYFIQDENRRHMQYEVSAAQSASGVKPEIYLPYTVRVDSLGMLYVLDVGDGGIRRINPATMETRHIANVKQRYETNREGVSGRGAAWFDVDRYGNSGLLNQVCWTATQQSSADGEQANHPNEAYACVPPDGGPSKWLFPNVWDPYPDGWGPRERTGAPHYGWTISVDPRGAWLLAGIGEHGFTRLRKMRATDPVPANDFDYLHGKEHWLYAFHLAVGPSAILKFGSEAHNYLGFADAWAYKNATDQQILDAFEIPAAVQADREKRRIILNFIRLNGANVVDASPRRR